MSKKPRKVAPGPRAALPEDIAIGKKLKIRRIELNLTQTEIANAAGVTFQQVGKYEKGLNRITPGRLSRLAAVLRVPKSFFYEDGKDSPEITTVLAGENTMGVRLLQAFSNIQSEIVQKGIVQMVEAIAKDRY